MSFGKTDEMGRRIAVVVVTLAVMLVAFAGSTATSQQPVSAAASVLSTVPAPPALPAPALAPPPLGAEVGALYVPSVLGLGPKLGLPHTCTASVVHSATHDLVLTAAHCVAGFGLGYQFVPGYAAGAMPYGVWRVTRIYVNRAWVTHQDPQHDYAFLRIARQTWKGADHAIEDVVGANTLGSAPVAGTRVVVTGYAAGSGDLPITCTAVTYEFSGFPAFDCRGFVAGTSGSPWTTAGRRVVGLIGGLHQGGCSPDTSYSPTFGADIAADLARAQSTRRGDVAPLAAGDGCPA